MRFSNRISNGYARRGRTGRGGCDGLASLLGESIYLAILTVGKLSELSASNDEAGVDVSAVLWSPS